MAVPLRVEAQSVQGKRPPPRVLDEPHDPSGLEVQPAQVPPRPVDLPLHTGNGISQVLVPVGPLGLAYGEDDLARELAPRGAGRTRRQERKEENGMT